MCDRGNLDEHMQAVSVRVCTGMNHGEGNFLGDYIVSTIL